MKEFKESYQMKITKIEVTKHFEGEANPRPGQIRYYFFIGTFTFETGTVIKKVLTESRKEFEKLDTVDVRYNEKKEAQEEALREYNAVKQALSHPDFAYARAKQYGVALYKRDAESPSSVSQLCGASSYKLVEYLQSNAAVLSPTEGLRSTGFRY